MGSFVIADQAGYDLRQHSGHALRGDASFAFHHLLELTIQLGADLQNAIEGEYAVLIQACRSALQGAERAIAVVPLHHDDDNLEPAAGSG
jgi:hypothetical protein